MELTSKSLMEIHRAVENLTGMHPDQVRAAKAPEIPYNAMVPPRAPDPLHALAHPLAEYIDAALKLLDCDVSWLYSPHDRAVRPAHRHGARVHEAKLIWSMRHPVLDLTLQWIGDSRGGDEAEWRGRLAEMADLIKDEKAWFVKHKQDLPKLVPPMPMPQLYGHGVVYPQAHYEMSAQLGAPGGMAQQTALQNQVSAEIQKMHQRSRDLAAKVAPPPMIDDMFDIKKSGWM